MTLQRKAHLRGTHRLVSPAETYARVSPMLRAFGITRVADVTGLDTIGIPVVMVCRPNARSLAVAQGKGIDLDCARVSGVMESIEQWHAEHILRPMRFTTAAELSREQGLVALDGLPRMSLGAFDAHRKRLWIDGVDLLDTGTRWVPLDVVHADYTLPPPPGSGCFLTTSTGLASGNHQVEAVLHALYETIERDAVALWYLLCPVRRASTRVALDTINDQTCRELLARFDAAGVAVGVWDATSEFGLPVFVAEVLDRSPGPWRGLGVSGGQGCHRSRAIALSRALTEAAQSRLTMIAGARDDVDRAAHARWRDPRAAAARRAELVEPTVRSFLDIPDGSGATLEEDLESVLDALRAVGLTQAVVVDLTRPEFGVPVVRVVVPGLESSWDAPGYAPGPRAQRARAL